MRPYVGTEMSGSGRYARYQFLLVSWTFFILVILFLPNAAADPLAYVTGSFVGDDILNFFMLNLVFNAMILLIPIFFLKEAGKEKRIEPLCLNAILLVTMWGAYIDGLVFSYMDTNGESLLPVLIGLSAVALTYLVITVPVLGYKVKTGVIVGLFALLINGFCWSLFISSIPYNHFDEVSLIYPLVIVLIISAFNHFKLLKGIKEHLMAIVMSGQVLFLFLLVWCVLQHV